MNAIAQRQRAQRSENRAPRSRGVAAVQRAAGAICCLLATLATGQFATAARRSHAFPDQPPPAASVRPPGVAPSLVAYNQVAAFIHNGEELPDLVRQQPGAAALPDVAGCSVVLRLAGEIVGSGSAFNAPGTPPSTAPIYAAARAAWEKAEPKLPVSGTPEKRAEKIKLLRQDLLISIELAGAPIPLTAATFADCDKALQPGIDGVVVVIANNVGTTFPGTAASAGLLPADTLRRATSGAASAARGEDGNSAALTLLEPQELAKKHGASFYTFRTTHFAQARADQSPELLYRGQRLILSEDVNELEELWHMADRLAGNLVNRLTAQPAAGVITLSSGTAEPLDPKSAALARQALLEYSTRWPTPKRTKDLGEPTAQMVLDRTRSAAVEYLRLARQGADGLDERDRLANNALVARHADVKLSPEEQALAANFHDGVLNDTVPAGLRGLVIWGSSSSQAQAAGNDTPAHAMEKSVRAVMAQTPIASLPGEMPWLGWVDLEIDRHFKRPPGVKSAAALREMRTLIWKHQLQSVDAGPDRQDLVGGITTPAPTATPGSPDPLPTAQTAQLVAFLATMLGEPELTTKAERPGEIVRLLAATRYLRQLQVDDAMSWMCKDPVMAKGGIRVATWDQHTRTDSTSMALLAVLEVIDGLEKAAAAKP